MPNAKVLSEKQAIVAELTEKILQGNISGYAVPKFVIDAPGGGGKIPVGYNYVTSMDDDKVVMENYKGIRYTYPQPACAGGETR